MMSDRPRRDGPSPGSGVGSPGGAGHAHAHDDPDQDRPEERSAGSWRTWRTRRRRAGSPSSPRPPPRARRAQRNARGESLVPPSRTTPRRADQRGGGVRVRRRPRRRRGRALRPVAAVLRRGGGDRRNGRGCGARGRARRAPGRAASRAPRAWRWDSPCTRGACSCWRTSPRRSWRWATSRPRARRQPRSAPRTRHARAARMKRAPATLDARGGACAIAKRAETADADADARSAWVLARASSHPRAGTRGRRSTASRPRPRSGSIRRDRREAKPSSRRPLGSFPSRRAPDAAQKPSGRRRRVSRRVRGAAVDAVEAEARSRGETTSDSPSPAPPRLHFKVPPATPSGRARTRLRAAPTAPDASSRTRPGLGRRRFARFGIRRDALALLGASVPFVAPGADGGLGARQNRPIPRRRPRRTPKPPGPPRDRARGRGGSTRRSRFLSRPRAFGARVFVNRHASRRT